MASAKGATVETPEAPEGGVYGGSVPLSNGGEVWGEGCAPPQIFFLIFELKMVKFRAFWLQFWLPVLHANRWYMGLFYMSFKADVFSQPLVPFRSLVNTAS